LAGVADAVGAAEPHGVVEVAVDGLGVVAAGEEPFEVGVAGWDGAQVLGAVELARRVLVVAVEPDRDGLVVVAGGELVVVVPAVAAVLVPAAVGADARQPLEVWLAGVGELDDSECAAVGVETKRPVAAVGEGDGLVFEVDVLLDPSVVASCLGWGGLGGGDAVDGEEAEFAED